MLYAVCSEGQGGEHMANRTVRLDRAIGAYFAACDATRERRELKNGGVEERVIL